MKISDKADTAAALREAERDRLRGAVTSQSLRARAGMLRYADRHGTTPTPRNRISGPS